MKIILKGIKNQMLLNYAFGIKRTLKPKSGSQFYALTCIQVDPLQVRQECIDWQGFQFQQFIHCGSFRLKVKEWITGFRSVPLPDPDSYWTTSLATLPMASSTARPAENEGKTLIGVKATHKTFVMLDTIEKRGVASQLPGRFTMYDEEDGPCTDRAINKWIDVVKIPIIAVASLAFVSRRSGASLVTHALQLLIRTFRECTLQNELDMKAENYVGTASRMMKVFSTAARTGENHQTFRLIFSEDCAAHAKDLRDVLKDNCAVLIGGGKTAQGLFKLMTTSNVMNLGALNTTHPPSNSFFEQLRKRKVFLTTNQKRWAKKPKEDQQAMNQAIQDMYDMCADLKSELASLGYALRRHNARHIGDRQNQIIIQDVVRDWLEFRYDLSIERAAAVTHTPPDYGDALVIVARLVGDIEVDRGNLAHEKDTGDQP